MISNLQVLRALAALAVVFYHTDFHFFGIHTEFQGVALFFVISGFIMTYISRESADGFLTKRLIRIVPLYWLFTLAVILPRWAAQGALHAHMADGYDDPTTYIELAKSLLFIPYMNPEGTMQPLLGVGWTLNLEMFFYLLFAGALAINKRFAPIIAALVLIAIKVISPLYDSQVLSFYAHPYTTFFILGMASFYLWRIIPGEWITNKSLLAALSTAVAAVFIGSNLHPAPMVVTIAMPGLVVFTALLLHKGGVICRWRPLLLLGDASYALYLCHTLLILVFQKIGQHWPLLAPKTNLAVDAFLMVTASIAAVFIYQKIEHPIIKALRKRFERRPGTAPAQAAEA